MFFFCEASQNLSLFRQFFFHNFQGGTKGKMLKNCHNYTLVFERLHEIKKEAYAENLSCLSHWEPRKLPRPPQLWAR